MTMKEYNFMRKLIAILAAVTVFFSAAAFAEGLSAVTDEELLALYQDVLDEMERRGLSAEPETDSAQAGITERVLSFFAAWSRNDLDEMLALCSSGWKAGLENPKMELFRILANRTALDAAVNSVGEIAGEDPDSLLSCRVTVTADLDRNNGKAPRAYFLEFVVSREADGLWYINPTGLASGEIAETTAAPADPADGVAADTVLYYHPNGGEYYHLDRNCRTVHPRFLPLEGSFLYSELDQEPYRELKPCKVCGATTDSEEE